MTNATTKTNRMNPLTFIAAMVVAAVFAFSLAACGGGSSSTASTAASTTEESTAASAAASATATSSSTSTSGNTLQSLLSQDASSKEALNQIAQQMADSFSTSSGIDCTTEVNCVDNNIEAIINAAITKADLNGASLDDLFTSDEQVQTMSQTVATLEKSTGIEGITFTFTLNDSTGALLGTATYNSTGLAK